MNPTLLGGLVLGCLVSAWTFFMGVTGWYKDPARVALFWMVIPIQIAVVVWSLSRTSTQAGYGRQVVNGVAMSVMASLFIFGGSLLFTTVVFPNYFKDLEAIGRLKMAQQGLSQARIEELIGQQAPWQKSLPTAFAGVFGTWVTGLVTSLLAAAWFRRRG